MPGRLGSRLSRRLGVILLAAAVVGCEAPETVLVERTERVPCPLALPEVACAPTPECPSLPDFPETVKGTVIDAEIAWRCGKLADACKAAQIRVWRADYAACVKGLAGGKP